jgi:hypothetical protein
MPNHVYSTLIVRGHGEEIRRFKNQAATFAPGYHDEDDTPTLSFWNFVRPPQESIDSGRYHATHGWVAGKESGNTPDNWYNWNRANWGTKWDAYNVEVVEGSRATRIEYRFTTAWSAPDPVLAAMAEQFPLLRFELKFREEGGDDGVITAENGFLMTV